MNIPNLLTIARILLTIPICLLVYIENHAGNLSAFILFSIAGITDFLDGYIARKYNLGSKLGKALDPIADKVLVSSLLVVLTNLGYSNPAFAVLIIAREIIVSGIREVAGSTSQADDFAVTNIAKAKTSLQIISISILIIAPILEEKLHLLMIGNVILLVACIMSLYTGIIYIARARRMLV